MFKVNDLRELIRAVDNSNIEELVVKGENSEKVVIRKKGAEVVAQKVVETAPVAAPAPVAPVAAAPTAAPAAPVAAVEVQTPAATPEVADENLHKVVSPMVGTFYVAPAPDADPYVKKGDQVTADSIVCIVEAMKLMNEIEAEVEGEIVEVLAENGQLVEYGQPLFLIKK